MMRHIEQTNLDVPDLEPERSPEALRRPGSRYWPCSMVPLHLRLGHPVDVGRDVTVRVWLPVRLVGHQAVIDYGGWQLRGLGYQHLEFGIDDNAKDWPLWIWQGCVWRAMVPHASIREALSSHERLTLEPTTEHRHGS